MLASVLLLTYDVQAELSHITQTVFFAITHKRKITSILKHSFNVYFLAQLTKNCFKSMHKRQSFTNKI